MRVKVHFDSQRKEVEGREEVVEQNWNLKLDYISVTVLKDINNNEKLLAPCAEGGGPGGRGMSSSSLSSFVVVTPGGGPAGIGISSSESSI